ncbi:MAG: glycosyltransferase family 9 protein [Gammaproteobacteria bacterium]|nr:glycosyltransferase family 9 protein [Gammaproteobacteria bacterium]
MSAPLNRPPASLCILRLSAIGDVTHVVPVIRTLQAHWPETRLTWVIGKVEAELVGDIPGVEFIVFDKRDGLQAFRQLRQRLAGRRFDILLHMQIALRASIASRLIPARLRLGFDRSEAKNAQWLFCNAHTDPHPRQHVLDGFFGFLEKLGIRERVMRWDIPIPEQARRFVDAHVTPGQRLLVINPCSSARLNNWRNWSVEGYAAVADHAIRQHGMQVVFTGGPAQQERDYAAAILAAMQQPALNLVGKTRLKELLALIDRAEAVIAPDTGPMHIATTVGTPVIGLFATSNTWRSGPYLSQQWVVDVYPEALQRFNHLRVEDAPWGMRVRNPAALDLITLEAVREKLDQILESAQQLE